MLKPFRSGLAALCLLVLGLDCALALVPQAQPYLSPGNAQPEKKPSNIQSARYSLSVEAWAVIFTAVFTGVIALYAIFQFGEARRSSQRQLRAYVSAHPTFMYAFDTEHPPRVTMDLVNVGLTPALNLRQRIGIDLLDFPYRPTQSLPALTAAFSAPMALFPRAPFFAVGIGRVFTPAELADIRKGSKRVCVYGELVYYDVFRKKERRTTFCQALTADNETIGKLTRLYHPNDLKINFEVAPMGNDAT